MNAYGTYVKDVATGIFMGASMLVPSFSAGTAALVAGRYELVLRLIDMWREILLAPITHYQMILRGVSLGVGVVATVASLANVIATAMTSWETQVISFFIGLILATALVFTPSAREWTRGRTWIGIATVTMLVSLTQYVTATIPLTVYTAPLLAILAVTAMLLPGVSGSYMLLVVGTYGAMIQALSNPLSNTGVLIVFGVTGIIYAELIADGIITLLDNHRDTAHTLIFALLLSGGCLLIYQHGQSYSTLPYLALGLTTYPVIDYLQTNKST
jgi:putative membrane protein